MAEIVNFRSRSSADQEAAVWIARLDRGLSGSDEADLCRWLAAHPSNRTALIELAALWDEADRLAELAGLFPLQQRDDERVKKTRVRWSYAAGAVLAFSVCVAWLAYDQYAPAPERAVSQELEAAYSTAVGMRVREVLPDGSAVTLNTRTELETSYTADAREVVLRSGEASFEVTHDPRRPFTVYAGGSAVRALGTVFNVRLGLGGEVEVTVTDGNVGVAHSDGQGTDSLAGEPSRRPAGAWDAVVAAGEVVVFEAAQTAPQVLRLEPVDMDIKLAWKRGMLIFRGEPLDDVLEEVARYTTTEFVLADQELASIRVGGYFRAGDVEGLLAALRENFQIEAEAGEGDMILLRGAR